MKLNLKDTLNQIKILLTSEVKVNLEALPLMDDVTIIEAETFEVGSAVFIVTETENVPLPVGSYELKDGRILVVEVEGIIASIGEAPVVEEVQEVEAAEEETQVVDEPNSDVVSRKEFDAKIAELQLLIDELKASLNLSQIDVTNKDVELAKLKVELSAKPATTKLKDTEIKLTSTNNKPATKFAYKQQTGNKICHNP